MQCVVRGFLETSAHKPHRYISRYREIFEIKSRLIDRKIRYTHTQTQLCSVVMITETENQILGCIRTGFGFSQSRQKTQHPIPLFLYFCCISVSVILTV